MIEQLVKERDEMVGAIQTYEAQLPQMRLRVAYLCGRIDLLAEQEAMMNPPEVPAQDTEPVIKGE